MGLRIAINGISALLGTLLANGGFYLLHYYVGGFEFIWVHVMSVLVFLVMIVANLIKLLIRQERKLNNIDNKEVIKRLDKIEHNYANMHNATLSTLNDSLRLFRKIGGQNGL